MLWPGLSLKPVMRVDAIKIHRSTVYYLINTVTPINHALKAKLDTYGSVIVVGLIVGIVTLVRLVLGCVHLLRDGNAPFFGQVPRQQQ